MKKSVDREEMVSQRRELRKKTPKKFGKLRFAAVLVLVFAAIYLLIAIFASMSSNLSTTVAFKGTVREDIRTTGYVFRQQTIINSPASGHLECMVGEGERVKEGQVVGYIYQTPPDPVILEQIKNASDKLARLKGIEGEKAVYAGDSGLIERKIAQASREFSDVKAERDLRNSANAKEDINLLIENRQGLTGDEISRLEGELSSLKSQAGPSAEVVASAGGVFSTHIDGLEEQLAYDKAMTVDVTYLRELDKAEEKAEQVVEFGRPLCKIINNYTWYFAAEIDEKKAEELREGQSVELDFFDLTNIGVKGTIRKITQPDGGKCAVVIGTNRYVDGIYSTSRINADIVTVAAEGIKLPANCMRVKDGVVGVYVIRLDAARFVPVNKIYGNEDWVIISAAEAEPGRPKLQIYDEVIVECKNLEDGKVVR